jgi:hypothetical protein
MREREDDAETEARRANEALKAALRLKKRTARAVQEALRQRAAEELDVGAASSDDAAEALAEEVAKTVAAKDALAVEVARGEADRVAHVNEGDTLKEAVSARLKDLEARAEASKEKAATFMTMQVRGIRKFIEDLRPSPTMMGRRNTCRRTRSVLHGAKVGPSRSCSRVPTSATPSATRTRTSTRSLLSSATA